jgi:hypothetical protein
MTETEAGVGDDDGIVVLVNGDDVGDDDGIVVVVNGEEVVAVLVNVGEAPVQEAKDNAIKMITGSIRNFLG